jgi:hypothetical protein
MWVLLSSSLIPVIPFLFVPRLLFFNYLIMGKSKRKEEEEEMKKKKD